MVQPASILNSTDQRVDTLYVPSGGSFVKLAIGDKTISGITPHAAWQGVASHADGTNFVAADGVMVIAGIDGTVVRPMVVDTNGNLVLTVKPSIANIVDRSGSITTGGSAQQIAASNVTRKYFLLQNLHASADLWFNFGTTAVQDQPSLRLAAGQSFVMEASYVSGQLVSAIGPTTGQKFTAKEA